mgnify:FL=1
MGKMRTPKKTEVINIGKVFLFFIFLSLLQIGITYIFVRQSSLNQIYDSLQNLSQRIQHDIKYDQGKWDTKLYNADPFTPYPHGSSGFSQPLYIITSEGFVIERNRPINNLLDSSDFKHLLAFSKPQSISTVTNENWRVLSKPIKTKNDTVGVILVAFYNHPSQIADIDKKLEENLEQLSSQVRVRDGHIDTSNIDIRNVHYDVAFEIANNFNKVLINNGRTPSFIDPSYIETEFQFEKKRIVEDKLTKEKFLITTQPFIDKNRETRGVIVAGQSISPLNEILYRYIIFALFTSIILIFPLSFFTIFSLRREIKEVINQYEKSKQIKKLPSIISFDKKQSILFLDEKVIAIPYASNQYYLIDALFLHPKKRWESDELLSKFGENINSENWRTVYDAMLSINKKVGFKLISYKDRTYTINPSLIPLIS